MHKLFIQSYQTIREIVTIFNPFGISEWSISIMITRVDGFV